MHKILFKKKASLSLSINFIVMLILSLIMLGLGVTFLYQIVTGTSGIKDSLDEDAKREIERILLNTNEVVAFPYYKADIQRGGRDVLGVGIRNNISDGATFELQITCKKAFKNNLDFDTICDTDVGADCNNDCGPDKIWTHVNDDDITIDYLNQQVIPIFITVEKDVIPGMYLYNLRVKGNRQQHGLERTFVVNVI
ncbi:MAG: hypothetical protein ACLFPJ_02850 [Candidatus Woesearchaeota archaeon]